MKQDTFAGMSNAARARLLARICVALADRLGGEVRIPLRELQRGGAVGFAIEGDEILVALGDREPLDEPLTKEPEKTKEPENGVR